ncbi:MAG: DMT family transporter [Fervidicoccaceae archaeon]
MRGSQKYLVIYVAVSIPLNFIAKDLLLLFNPFFLTAIRSLVMMLVLIFLRMSFPRIERYHVLMAALIYISTILWLESLIILTPGDSIVLGYSMPVIAVFLGWVLLGEREKLWPAIISFLGFIIYAYPISTRGSIEGAVISLSNAFFWALYSVLYRKSRNDDPLETNAAIFTVLTLMSIPTALLERVPLEALLSPRYIIDLFWLSIAGGAFQFISWNKLLLIDGVEKATVESYLVPIGVLLTQFLIFKISPYIIQIAGLGLALFGIIISAKVKNNSQTSTRKALQVEV